MDFSSAFPIDLVLFGMIAAFLVLRLRSILGRRTGYERPPQPYQPPAGRPGAGNRRSSRTGAGQILGAARTRPDQYNRAGNHAHWGGRSRL